ncbi:uncharacterized protein I303_100058 [Kwoniella dejecticola CBS 10117]|uniref:Uncharacterized protein n=1 Tax=Kwoniella dejecticola CBS 10117 TaxID=1296121 RepID=A0A1A6ADV2_9TREE|nr:uncharacterized protein I303_00058 [Kwoniella dejecticola CBS 10117]OBR88247.1 hypothetical protein I303_00058 [Kwoniella dejecticola CBS 10117]
MRSTFTALLSLISLLALTKAQEDNYSNPILVAKPDCETMDQFQVNFEKLCPIWIPPPTASDGWYYDSTSFVRGGTDGNSPEYLATVNCLYKTRGGEKNVAFEIVQSLGGAIANEGI